MTVINLKVKMNVVRLKVKLMMMMMMMMMMMVSMMITRTNKLMICTKPFVDFTSKSYTIYIYIYTHNYIILFLECCLIYSTGHFCENTIAYLYIYIYNYGVPIL